MEDSSVKKNGKFLFLHHVYCLFHS